MRAENVHPLPRFDNVCIFTEHPPRNVIASIVFVDLVRSSASQSAIRQSVFLSVRPSLRPSVRTPVVRLSVRVSVRPSVRSTVRP